MAGRGGDESGDEVDARADVARAEYDARPETGCGESGDGKAGESTERSPTDVFELVADETRLAIVRELAKRRWSNWRLGGLSFAELRRAVGERDAGNFSYHLEKLRDELVGKRDGEYFLRNRGLKLAGAVASDVYTSGGEPRRGAVEYGCPHANCTDALEAVYDQQYFRVECPDHGVFYGATLSPGLVEHGTVEELVDFAVLNNRQDVERARMGVCPLCSGPMDATLPVLGADATDQPDMEWPDDAVLAAFDCDQCGMAFDVPAGICIVEHPAVVALYHDHGRDPRRELPTELPFTWTKAPVVESTDPVRVRVDVELAGETLSLWLDGDASVVEYERD